MTCGDVVCIVSWCVVLYCCCSCMRWCCGLLCVGARFVVLLCVHDVCCTCAAMLSHDAALRCTVTWCGVLCCVVLYGGVLWLAKLCCVVCRCMTYDVLCVVMCFLYLVCLLQWCGVRCCALLCAVMLC